MIIYMFLLNTHFNLLHNNNMTFSSQNWIRKLLVIVKEEKLYASDRIKVKSFSCAVENANNLFTNPTFFVK